ncbi:MAG TPA: glycosyltransferase family 4 protein, partial [Gaiellaceae bacterium]|nr:glycosyltransferase family 4 protein [Gaiellaceae bacterium]
NRPEGFDGDVWQFYGVPPNFRRVTLPTPLTLRLSGMRRLARGIRALPLVIWLAARSRPGAERFVVYSRSMLGAWLAVRLRRMWGSRSACQGVFLELHDAPSEDARRTLRDADGLVTISDVLRRHLVDGRWCTAMGVLVEHDGVDPRSVDSAADGHAVRCRLGIDDDLTIVGYTGRVNAGKGINTILEAASRLQRASAHFLVVGKQYDADAEATARGLGNVTITGFVPPSAVPSYLAACDILAMPTSATLPYSRFTSPLKLFEYMASGRPIVCSDLPVLREVLRHMQNAVLVPPDDPASLADAIERLMEDPTLRRSLAKQALLDAQEHTWDKRAARLLSWIETRSPRPRLSSP